MYTAHITLDTVANAHCIAHQCTLHIAHCTECTVHIAIAHSCIVHTLHRVQWACDCIAD